MLLSLVLTYFAKRISLGFWREPVGWTEICFVLVGMILLVGSRDTYRKYVLRGNKLLAESPSTNEDAHAKPHANAAISFNA